MTPAGKDRVGELSWPPEWFGIHSWLRTDLVSTLVHKASGSQVFIAGGVLTDGTNLIGACFPGGQHIARTFPPDWVIEERIDPHGPKWMRPIWRRVIGALVQAKRDAEAEIAQERGQ
jgi:hypothetical protein